MEIYRVAAGDGRRSCCDSHARRRSADLDHRRTAARNTFRDAPKELAATDTRGFAATSIHWRGRLQFLFAGKLHFVNALGKFLDHLLIEGGKVIGFAARDQSVI